MNPWGGIGSETGELFIDPPAPPLESFGGVKSRTVNLGFFTVGFFLRGMMILFFSGRKRARAGVCIGERSRSRPMFRPRPRPKTTGEWQQIDRS